MLAGSNGLTRLPCQPGGGLSSCGCCYPDQPQRVCTPPSDAEVYDLTQSAQSSYQHESDPMLDEGDAGLFCPPALVAFGVCCCRDP